MLPSLLLLLCLFTSTPSESPTRMQVQEGMHSGAAIPSLVRFNKALLALDENDWQDRLKPVLSELCFNLESFNPAFAAVILRVQSTIGNSDYLRRDAALKQLIVPLAGEYGMHNGEQQSALLPCATLQCAFMHVMHACMYAYQTPKMLQRWHSVWKVCTCLRMAVHHESASR